MVAAVVVAFLAGEVEVHERLWAHVGAAAQVAGVPHDFATACRRHKDRPWVGAKVVPARRPGTKADSGKAAHKTGTNASGNVSVNASGNASSREHQHGGPTARSVERRPASDGE